MDFAPLIEAIRGSAAGQKVGDHDFIPLPHGIDVRDLENFHSAPRRHRGHIKAHESDTFVAYFNRHKDIGSVIFADLGSSRIWGELDHHAPHAEDGTPGFREHRVTYNAAHSLEWGTWTRQHGKLMAQAEFALFVEDNIIDIREPAGAEMLEIARTFEAKSRVEFQSAVRLDSGARQFIYQEQIQGAAAKGTIKVPERFKLGIPVFQGGEIYEIEARLRWRIGNQQLAIGFELYRHQQIEQDAFRRLTAVIADETETPVWFGAPE